MRRSRSLRDSRSLSTQVGAQDLGQRAAGEAAQRVHLPQPVLRRHVALDEKGILQAGGADVRFAVCIEIHSGAGGQRRVDGAGALRADGRHTYQ